MHLQSTEIRKSDDLQDSFLSAIDFIKSRWKWLATGCAIGLLAAVSFLVVVQEKYEAKGMIQTATVGAFSSVPTGTQIAAPIALPVEPLARTLERLRLVTFYGKDIVEECNASSAKSLVEERLKIRSVRGSDLIHIAYAANSPRAAVACIAKVVERIKKSQSAVAEPAITVLENQLAYTKKRIEIIEKFLAQAQARRGVESLTPAESILIMVKSEELMKWQARYQDESKLLSEPFTQSAKLIEPIQASEEAIFPRRFATITIGIVGGLCLSLGVLFLVRGRSLYRTCVDQSRRRHEQ